MVRILDEITIDLIHKVGEIEFSNASIIEATIGGVLISIADLDTLIETKKEPEKKTKLIWLFWLRFLTVTKPLHFEWFLVHLQKRIYERILGSIALVFQAVLQQYSLYALANSRF